MEAETILTISIILLIVYILKVLLILQITPTLTSPFLLPTSAILFWYVGGNFLNILSHKYLFEEHELIITLLISMSYMLYLIGLLTGFLFNPRMVKRTFPFIEKINLIKLLYIITFISFIGSSFYLFPIIRAIADGSYYLNRINMIFGRGYLAKLCVLHSFALPFIVTIKLSTKSKITTLDKLLILISFCIAIIPLHRGPILTQSLMYLFIYNDLYKKISLKKITISVVAFILVLGVLIPHIRGTNRSILTTIRNEIRVHMWNLSKYINMTDTIGEFGFKPITMALMIPLPGHQDSFEIWIKQYSDISVNIGGASMSLIGEGYMEFKWIGVFCNFFVFGILIALLFKYRQVSPWGYMTYIYFLNRSESIIQFGFSKVLISLIFAVVLFALFNQYNFKKYPPTVPI